MREYMSYVIILKIKQYIFSLFGPKARSKCIIFFIDFTDRSASKLIILNLECPQANLKMAALNN